MEVVRSLQEGSRYTLWYPFQASRTFFLVLAGTMEAWWKDNGHGVMGLPRAVLVKRLEVHSSPRSVVLLGDHNHPVTPGSWGAGGDLLYHSNSLVPVEPGLHLLLPVEGDGAVSCHRLGSLLSEYLERWAVHLGERLALTTVEG